MFDFSFGELAVIGAVALVVIGPERLPAVARTAGAMVARLKRYVAGVKADIQREVELENLRQIEAEMNEAGRSLKQDIVEGMAPVEESLHAAVSDTQAALSEPPTHSVSVAQPASDQQFDLFAPPPAPQPRPERDRR
ncbi:Sec-independent protein translocase protein TatB [Chitinimonas sp.]|uniref:Sec-independent protein translocase protein TatB n=1 Tax=Chitinimonas sp. TaxID=1934313 RepID=UPI002F95C8D1